MIAKEEIWVYDGCIDRRGNKRRDKAKKASMLDSIPLYGIGLPAGLSPEQDIDVLRETQDVAEVIQEPHSSTRPELVKGCAAIACLIEVEEGKIKMSRYFMEEFYEPLKRDGVNLKGNPVDVEEAVAEWQRKRLLKYAATHPRDNGERMMVTTKVLAFAPEKKESQMHYAIVRTPTKRLVGDYITAIERMENEKGKSLALDNLNVYFVASFSINKIIASLEIAVKKGGVKEIFLTATNDHEVEKMARLQDIIAQEPMFEGVNIGMRDIREQGIFNENIEKEGTTLQRHPERRRLTS